MPAPTKFSKRATEQPVPPGKLEHFIAGSQARSLAVKEKTGQPEPHDFSGRLVRSANNARWSGTVAGAFLPVPSNSGSPSWALE